MNFSDKKTKRLYDELMNALDSHDAPQKEMMAFGKWMDDLERNLMGELSKALDKIPEEIGFAEALTLSIGRFACRFLELMQRKGYVSEGVDIYQYFREALLPVCHRLVVKEMDDEEETERKAKENGVSDRELEISKIIVRELMGDKMTVEEIVDKYIQTDDRETTIKEFEEMRRSLRE